MAKLKQLFTDNLHIMTFTYIGICLHQILGKEVHLGQGVQEWTK